MKLIEFDKLKNLVDQLIGQNREMRFKIAHLEKEINGLKLAVEQTRNLPENINEEFLHNLLTENERLKTKNRTVHNHLGELVTKLEEQVVQQNNSVGS